MNPMLTLGVLRLIFQHFGAVLEASWGVLGQSWRRHGASWEGLGGPWRCPVRVFGLSEGILGRLGPSSGRLGGVVARFEKH